MKTTAKYVTFAFALFFASMQSAHAYLDPGAASMVLQVLIGGVAATVGVFSLYYNKIKKFFSKLLKQKA